MKSLRTTAAALLLVAIATGTDAQSPAEHESHHAPQTATPAPAQPMSPPGQSGMGGQQGMMGMMRMMGMMGPGMATIDRVEGRIAFLRAELKITEAQAGAWDAFAAALRTNAQKLAEVRAAMMPKQGAGQALTMAARLDLQERWLLARLEGTRAIKPAFTNLYGTLSDDQKKTADELLAPHMGMGMTGMMGMMHGEMQPGQMQPGQMQPGQMRPGQMPPPAAR